MRAPCWVENARALAAILETKDSSNWSDLTAFRLWQTSREVVVGSRIIIFAALLYRGEEWAVMVDLVVALSISRSYVLGTDHLRLSPKSEGWSAAVRDDNNSLIAA